MNSFFFFNVVIKQGETTLWICLVEIVPDDYSTNMNVKQFHLIVITQLVPRCRERVGEWIRTHAHGENRSLFHILNHFCRLA